MINNHVAVCIACNLYNQAIVYASQSGHRDGAIVVSHPTIHHGRLGWNGVDSEG